MQLAYIKLFLSGNNYSNNSLQINVIFIVVGIVKPDRSLSTNRFPINPVAPVIETIIYKVQIECEYKESWIPFWAR